jgi:hypothetical protein
MANIKKMDCPTLRNIYVDNTILKAIKEKDPDFNLSAECNAMLKEKYELQKNEQALDPLNIRNVGAANLVLPSNTRQTSLFEAFAEKDHRDAIVKYVQSIQDTLILNKIEKNAKCMLKVSQVHRMAIFKR